MTKILGLKPKYFRPPYGKYNDQVLQVAAQRGYTKMILWSDDTQDASGECEFVFTCDPGLPGCRERVFRGHDADDWSWWLALGAPVWQSKQTYDNINGQSGRIVLNHNVIPGSKSVLARPAPNCLLEALSLWFIALIAAVYDVVPHALSVTGSLQKVSIDTCLGSEGEWPYYWVQNPGNRDGSWTC